MTTTRRNFLRIAGLGAATLALPRGAGAGPGSLPLQRFNLSLMLGSLPPMSFRHAGLSDLLF